MWSLQVVLAFRNVEDFGEQWRQGELHPVHPEPVQMGGVLSAKVAKLGELD